MKNPHNNVFPHLTKTQYAGRYNTAFIKKQNLFLNCLGRDCCLFLKISFYDHYKSAYFSMKIGLVWLG